MIAGFILGDGTNDDRMLVRGIGPSLTAAGVPKRWLIRHWNYAMETGRWLRLTMIGRMGRRLVCRRAIRWSRPSRPRFRPVHIRLCFPE